MRIKDGMEAMGAIYKNFFVGRNKMVLALLPFLIYYNVFSSFYATVEAGLPMGVAFGVALFVFFGWTLVIPAIVYLMDKNDFFFKSHIKKCIQRW